MQCWSYLMCVSFFWVAPTMETNIWAQPLTFPHNAKLATTPKYLHRILELQDKDYDYCLYWSERNIRNFSVVIFSQDPATRTKKH